MLVLPLIKSSIYLKIATKKDYSFNLENIEAILFVYEKKKIIVRVRYLYVSLSTHLSII